MKKQKLKFYFLPVLLGLLYSGLWGQRSNTLSRDGIHVQPEQQASFVKFDSFDNIQIIKNQIPDNQENTQDIKPPVIEDHNVRSKQDYFNNTLNPASINSPEELNRGQEDPIKKLGIEKPGEVAVEEAGNYTINNFINSPVPDMSGILLTYPAPADVPADAAITGIEYCIRIIPDEAHANFYCADYEIFIKPAPTSYDWLCVYDNLGGINDEGHDDDDDNDADIWLSWRSTDEFNGEPVQTIVIYIADNISVSGYEGYGKVSYAHVKVYWTTPPATPTLVSPSNGSECLSTGTFVLDWSDVPDAVAYEIQLDENPLFSSPDAGLKYESQAIAVGAPANTTFFWRVRALNEAGSSSYSPIRSFTTEPAPPDAVSLDNPSNGADCQFNDLSLYWSATSGADSYQLMVDDNSDFSSPHFNEDGITSTNQMMSGLSNGTTYYWRVRGENSCGTYGSWSSSRSFTTSIAPSRPALSTPADFATCQSTSIAFSWGSAIGAESYHLMVDDNGDFSSPHYNEEDLSTTSQSVSGLSAGGATYYWRVRAKNACGHYGSWSLTNVFATLDAAPDEAAPSSPADAATCQALSPTITWNAGSGASSYVLQVDDNSDFSSPVLDEDGIAGTSQALSGLSEGTTYHWRVKSVNSCEAASDWSSTMSFTTMISSIGIPVLSGPANDADCQPLSPTLSWESVTNAVEYLLEVDDNNDFSSPEYTGTCGGNTHNCEELSENIVYFWRISANGDCSVTGEWSDPWSFETGTAGMDMPSLASPVDLSTDQALSLSLAWSAVADAVEYQVQLDDNDDFSSPLYDEDVPGTSLAVSGLEEGTTYYWQMRAMGACSVSDWSDTWEFETGTSDPTPITGTSMPGYSLGQNYPNPFMESTTIEFTIPKEGLVKLEFMDLQGKLIDAFTGFYPAGNHTMEIKLSEKVFSGVYLYRMKTEGFIDTRLCVVR